MVRIQEFGIKYQTLGFSTSEINFINVSQKYQDDRDFTVSDYCTVIVTIEKRFWVAKVIAREEQLQWNESLQNTSFRWPTNIYYFETAASLHFLVYSGDNGGVESGPIRSDDKRMVWSWIARHFEFDSCADCAEMRVLGIDFAPLNVPWERRLQTLAAFTWIATVMILPWCFCALLAYLIFFTNFYWLPLLYGVYWYWDYDTPHNGGRM